MKQRKNLRKYKVKREVLKRDNYCCQKCGSIEKLEVHHIHSLFYGGLDITNNCISLCVECHKEAPSDIEEFNKWIKIKCSVRTDNMLRILYAYIFKFLSTYDSVSLDRVRNNPTEEWKFIKEILLDMDKRNRNISMEDLEERIKKNKLERDTFYSTFK